MFAPHVIRCKDTSHSSYYIIIMNCALRNLPHHCRPSYTGQTNCHSQRPSVEPPFHSSSSQNSRCQTEDNENNNPFQPIINTVYSSMLQYFDFSNMLWVIANTARYCSSKTIRCHTCTCPCS